MRGFLSRRRIVVLATLLAVAALPETSRAGEAGKVEAVTSVGFTVDDLDRSVAFFTGVLGFEKVSEVELHGAAWEKLTGVFGLRMRVATLRLGSETVELTDYLAPRGRPYPYDTRANDRWFQHLAIVVSDMDRAYARLREAGVEHASSGPQRLPESIPAAAGIRAFYFRDPDGHFLELIEFPPGKGDPRWQAAGGRDGSPFLGIDHTAIVVADTGRALSFYRDRLGLTVAGGSENFGVEQQHLNNVEGARLRITTLKAGRGPGIELLEYLAPVDGRAPAEPIRASDHAYWQTRLLVQEIPDGDGWKAGGGSRVPAGVTVPAEALGFDAAMVVRDPDGHAMQFTTLP